MGAHPYHYVVSYHKDPQVALNRLRELVFQRGEYYGADRHPRSPQEALELAEETGTRSILDIERVAKSPDYCCAAPLTPAELRRYFGTPTPTTAMVEQCDELWEELERGMARYVVTYEEGTPTHMVFIGYSFD